MSRYLVTGGGGFIGSRLARGLLDRGNEVVILDNLSTGHEENLPPQAELIQGDISRPDTVNLLPDGHFDAVLHLAAQASGEISHEHPGVDLNTNALGTLFLLEWCRQRGVPRFILASSMAVYGLADPVPVKEDQTLDPYSFYGIAKQAAEQYVRHYAKQGLDTTIFRMFNVYGPGQDLSNLKQGMVSIYLAFLANEQPVLVKGSLDRFRDFIYIDDIIDGWLTALDDPKSYGRVFNLASGRKTLVRELLNELIRAWGLDPETYTIVQGEGTPGDQFGISADITSISNDLGWQPKVDLSEGLSRMAEWAKSVTTPQGP